MAIVVMIYGRSGTGKSTSLRNFGTEAAIINVSGKPMPYRTKVPTYNTNDYGKVMNALAKTKCNTIVIDDATYLMVDELMRNASAKVKGYDQYSTLACNFYNLVKFAQSLPQEKIVYFLGHSEQMDDGREHFKTIGKMLDNYVTLEGEFTIVLKTTVRNGKYFFSTHNNGQDTVKSPMDMFDSDLIPNDLKMVDDTIREYWGLNTTTNNNEN